jgi:hypothetical protein
VDLLGPCGAFTESCRPLTFRCHLQAHPSRIPSSPDVLSSITLLADGDGELTDQSKDPASPCRCEQDGQKPENAFHRIVNLRAVTHRPCAGDLLRLTHSRAPFRLLPTRAPRQTVLRTSSRLAPSRFTNRSCDLPVEKTRDVSNRCLPPKRTACTCTSRVPDSLTPLSQRGHPTESKAPHGMTGGPDGSRHPRPLWRIVIQS